MRKQVFECDVCHKQVESWPNLPEGWYEVGWRQSKEGIPEIENMPWNIVLHACSMACFDRIEYKIREVTNG